MQNVFERGVPFIFVYRTPDPEGAVRDGIFGERHVVGDDFDNPRFGDGVVELLAKREVLLGSMVSVVKDDKRRRLPDNQCRFQKALGAFDGIASVEGGIFCQIAMFQQPAESPLVELVKTAGRRWRYEKNVSHGIKYRKFIVKLLGVKLNFPWKMFMKFPDLGEFRFVSKILEGAFPLKNESPSHRSWLSAGDDCAIFDGWLVTKDLSVENTHFRLDWASPEQAVEKHIVSNVSDISSMGGRPRIALFGLCVNRHWSEDTCNRIAKAVAQGFERRGITLIGGDTVSGEEGVFSTTLLGTTDGDTALLRSGAKPGDRVYVGGTLGKSDAGLWLLMNHPEECSRFQRLVDYHLAPRICEDMGVQLVKNGVRGACMDISDGLSSELNHLALSSDVSIEIDEKKLPIDEDVLEMCEFFGLSPLKFALNGGEEYELLFTSNLTKSIYLEGMPKHSEIHEIGFVNSGCGVYLNNKVGDRILLNAQAWSHL